MGSGKQRRIFQAFARIKAKSLTVQSIEGGGGIWWVPCHRKGKKLKETRRAPKSQFRNRCTDRDHRWLWSSSHSTCAILLLARERPSRLTEATDKTVWATPLFLHLIMRNTICQRGRHSPDVKENNTRKREYSIPPTVYQRNDATLKSVSPVTNEAPWRTLASATAPQLVQKFQIVTELVAMCFMWCKSILTEE